MAEETTKGRGWALFDAIVAKAAPAGDYSNPWVQLANGGLEYVPDFLTLQRLLGVPLHLSASSTTGVPALALDVWVAYELRRAGFAPDAVWPRASPPRVLPNGIAALLEALPAAERAGLERRLSARILPSTVGASSANILGKNYIKQVDVVMSDWMTGPELLVSTKRMDSSFGKNAANRVEESYGDAKNLRLRHPLAALGFCYGLRSTVFDEAPDTAEWIVDLLQKLGHEDDAYHAVTLLVLDYDSPLPVAPDDPGDNEDALVSAGLVIPTPDLGLASLSSDLSDPLPSLPRVNLMHDKVPGPLQPAHFLASLVERVLDATPVTMHREARRRRRNAQ